MDCNEDYSDQFEEETDSPSIDPDKEGAKSGRFKLIPFDQINLSTEPNYLIKGIIPRIGLTVVWGPAKCGKSFWCLNAHMSVARNVQYRDRKVKCGPVVYIALEGLRGFEARIAGYRQHCMEGHAGPVPFYLVGGTLDLVKDHAELIACIRTQVGGDMPAAVVIDTLNRSLSGSESSDIDMSAYIKAADAIRDAFGCAVTVVHHCGHDTSRPRGHTSLFGAADCMISVKRDGANNIVTAVQHMKDGEASEPMVDRLEKVDVGTDDDGDPITTCIVRPVDGEAVEPDTRKRGSDREVLAMEALTEALLDHGQVLPASLKLPNGTRGCKLDQWRDEMYARSILDREKDTSREKFSRLRDRLVRKQMIGVRNGWVWLVKPEGSAGFTPDL
jgi:hypothetical protein